MYFSTSKHYVSPSVCGEVPLWLEDSLLVGSGPTVDSAFVVEGQEVDGYFEEGELNNGWQ